MQLRVPEGKPVVLQLSKLMSVSLGLLLKSFLGEALLGEAQGDYFFHIPGYNSATVCVWGLCLPYFVNSG